MENRRLCTQGREITPPSRPLRYLVVGNAIGPRNNSIHQIVLFAGCASIACPGTARLDLMPRRGHGAVLNPGRATMSTKATTHQGNRDAISRDRILRCAGH